MKKFMLAAALLFAAGAYAQQPAEKPEGPYQFTDTFRIANTPVKNQFRSGTCWSFSGASFIESELLRAGKPEIDISEMWIVRNAYLAKADNYVRRHGETTLGAGSVSGDVYTMIEKFGIVPEEAYPGLNYGADKHTHAEMDAAIKGYLDGVIKNKTLSTAWRRGLEGILDAYLGPAPETFTYGGLEYTPKSFAEYLGVNTSDFVSLTSYTHHPFYSQFALEVQDNWAHNTAWNLPADEMMAAIDHALDNGYTINWSADVSEKGFAYAKGFAVVPDTDIDNMAGTEQSRWVAMTPAEREKAIYRFDSPVAEKTITQEMRQRAFDNYETTDDHGMHIVGKATDQNGNVFYIVKNSWGTDHIYGGYFYVSAPYMKYKTNGVDMNRNALPKDIRKKLGI